MSSEDNPAYRDHSGSYTSTANYADFSEIRQFQPNSVMSVKMGPPSDQKDFLLVPRNMPFRSRYDSMSFNQNIAYPDVAQCKVSGNQLVCNLQPARLPNQEFAYQADVSSGIDYAVPSRYQFLKSSY